MHSLRFAGSKTIGLTLEPNLAFNRSRRDGSDGMVRRRFPRQLESPHTTDCDAEPNLRPAGSLSSINRIGPVQFDDVQSPKLLLMVTMRLGCS